MLLGGESTIYLLALWSSAKLLSTETKISAVFKRLEIWCMIE